MKYLYLFIYLTFICACSGKNRVNLPEKTLLQNIENPDSILLQTFATDLDIFPVVAPKPGQQYLEERYKSADYKPANINLSDHNDNIRPLTLSQIANDIHYIRIKLPPEGSSTSTSFRGAIGGNFPSVTWPFEIVFTDNYLILSNVYGIYLYSRNGQLLDTLYKNQVNVMAREHSVMWQPKKMAGRKPLVDETNKKIYFSETNFEKQQFKILEYKADFLSGKIYNRNGETKKASMQLIRAFDTNHETYSFDLIKPGILAGHKSTMHGMQKQKDILTVLTSTGDTITSLKNNVEFKSFLANVARNPEPRISYSFKDNYSFKQEYNDTIFRFVPPNKLVPTYVFNFGDKKLSASDAYNTKVNIENKLHIESLIETPQFLLMKMSYGNDCPNQRKTGFAAFIGAYFDKRTREVYFLPPGRTKLPEELDIENDIDGGFPFWPTETSSKGELIQWISSESMKETLTAAWFAKSKAPENRKKELQKFVNLLEPGELVIITAQ